MGTALRNLGLIALVVVLLAFFAMQNNKGDKPPTSNPTGDPGRRITIEGHVTKFVPGQEKPRVHWKTLSAGLIVPQMNSADEGIPVDDDGHLRRSLGPQARGTHILVWISDGYQPGKPRPVEVCKIYADGLLVKEDNNQGGNDDFAVCEYEVV